MAETAVETQTTPTDTVADKPTEVATATPAAPAPPEEVKDTTPPILFRSRTPKGEPVTEDEAGRMRREDYTRKTQELARLREEFWEEKKRWVEERERALNPQTTPSDPREQVRTWREQGEHEAADRLLMDIVKREAEEAINPLKTQAQITNMKASFRELAAAAISDPVVAPYRNRVVEVFDSQDPDIVNLRAIAFRDEQTMRFMVPIIMRAIATQEHVMALEADLEKRVNEAKRTAVESEKARAAKLPDKLVRTGAVSRESGAAKGLTLRDVVRRSKEQLEGG